MIIVSLVSGDFLSFVCYNSLLNENADNRHVKAATTAYYGVEEYRNAHRLLKYVKILL